MGVSTDAIAFYGYHFDDDSKNSRKLEKIANEQSYADSQAQEIKIGMHCCDEATMWYLAGWELIASRGEPKRLKIPSKKERREMDIKIQAFLDQHQMTIKRKPKLWLASWWG